MDILSTLPRFLILLTLASPTICFLFHSPLSTTPLPRPSPSTCLHDGKGVAQTYSWSEDALELEIRVIVPGNTRAKDIIFECKPRSVGLKVISRNQEHAHNEQPQPHQELLFLDANRTMRGNIVMDGTFWNLEDNEDGGTGNGGPKSSRHIVVTIEKQMRPPRDDFEVLDYDWGGVYPDDEAEVLERNYQEPEELNLKEYAASLGVDIDNFDMSLVNKTMFTSGLNITQSTLQELEKRGLATEVTQQGDGNEYRVDDNGESVPFSPYGTGISMEEIQAATKSSQLPIPFLDTDSPWTKHQQADIDIDKMLKDAPISQKRGTERLTPEGSMLEQDQDTDEVAMGTQQIANDGRVHHYDPINELTVKRLKQILKEQGLKSTGNKGELQQRLREHVQSKLE